MSRRYTKKRKNRNGRVEAYDSVLNMWQLQDNIPYVYLAYINALSFEDSVEGNYNMAEANSNNYYSNNSYDNNHTHDTPNSSYDTSSSYSGYNSSSSSSSSDTSSSSSYSSSSSSSDSGGGGSFD